MPAFFTAAHVKLSVLLAILGALVAFIFTIMSGSGTVAIVVRPLVSALLMFVLASAIYALVAKKVPEAIDALENKHEETLPADGMAMNEGEMPEGGMPEGGEVGADFAGAEHESSLDSYDSGASASATGSIPKKMGVTVGKEEIIVNGVKFKNQPEVMAETIKQLMDQDKD
jgi:hypothetical protein